MALLFPNHGQGSYASDMLASDDLIELSIESYMKKDFSEHAFMRYVSWVASNFRSRKLVQSKYGQLSVPRQLMCLDNCFCLVKISREEQCQNNLTEAISTTISED
jgi:hypothetical protein